MLRFSVAFGHNHVTRNCYLYKSQDSNNAIQEQDTRIYLNTDLANCVKPSDCPVFNPEIKAECVNMVCNFCHRFYLTVRKDFLSRHN